VPLTWFPHLRPATAPIGPVDGPALDQWEQNHRGGSKKILRPLTQGPPAQVIRPMDFMRKVPRNLVEPSTFLHVLKTGEIPPESTALSTAASHSHLNDAKGVYASSSSNQNDFKGQADTPVVPGSITKWDSDSMEEVQKLSESEHKSRLLELSRTLSSVQRDELQISENIRQRMEMEYSLFSMAFLFRINGGPAVVRARLDQVYSVWFRQFRLSLLKNFVTKWKLSVEAQRYMERGGEYKRQAALQMLKEAVRRMLWASRASAMKAWTENTRLAIFSTRNKALRVIQKIHRRQRDLAKFLKWHDDSPVGGRLRDINLREPPTLPLPFRVPDRVRKERREIWKAAVMVQNPYRKRKSRLWFKKVKSWIVNHQSAVRMWSMRRWYEYLRLCSSVAQSLARMQKCRIEFITLRNAALVMQRNYRSYLARAWARVVKLARRLELERKLSVVTAIQSVWRGSKARMIRFEIEKDIREMFHAALVFQRAWYKHKDEFSTFVLLGCLREKDKEELAWKARLSEYWRNAKARFIQRPVVAWYKKRKAGAVETLQMQGRSYNAKMLLAHLRLNLISQRKIKFFLMTAMVRRHASARAIAFFWLKARPGRFLRHLRDNAAATRQEWLVAWHRRRHFGSSHIQGFIRGCWCRKALLRTKSAVHIERAYRGCLGRRIAKEKRQEIRFMVSAATTYGLLDNAVANEVTRKMALFNKKTALIQSKVRGFQMRQAMKELWHIVTVQEKMLLMLQRSWRSHNRVHKAVAALALQRRRLTNPYQQRDLGIKVLEDVMRDTDLQYDPFDLEKGMCMTMWLRRLGCSHLRPALEKLGCVDPLSVKKYALAHSEATLEDKIAFTRITKLSQGDEKAVKKFHIISDWSEVNRMFRAKFGENFSAKATGFVKAIKGHAVSIFMVEQHFILHAKNGSAARDKAPELLVVDQKDDEDAHDKARVRKCADLYQYAIEKCIDLFNEDFMWRKELNLSFDTIRKEPVIMTRLRKLRTIVDKLTKWNKHAAMVQCNWRGREGRIFVWKTKHSQLLVNAEDDYLKYRNENKVKQRWLEQRKKEEEEHKQWQEEQRIAAIEAELDWSLMFGWEEIFDEESQASYYKHTDTEVEGWDRPIYILEEYEKCVQIQNIARGRMAKKIFRRMKRAHYQKMEKRKARADWDRGRKNRDRVISLKFHVRMKPRKLPQEATVDGEEPAKDRRDYRRQHLVSGFAEQCKMDYQFKRGRIKMLPPWARGPDPCADALLKMMALSVEDMTLNDRVEIAARIPFTFVEPPYEWEGTLDANSGNTFYYNYKTGVTQWEKPRYVLLVDFLRDPPPPAYFISPASFPFRTLQLYLRRKFRCKGSAEFVPSHDSAPQV
jgi:hypothetical protein